MKGGRIAWKAINKHTYRYDEVCLLRDGGVGHFTRLKYKSILLQEE